jgi:hypothetical protein
MGVGFEESPYWSRRFNLWCHIRMILIVRHMTPLIVSLFCWLLSFIRLNFVELGSSPVFSSFEVWFFPSSLKWLIRAFFPHHKGYKSFMRTSREPLRNSFPKLVTDLNKHVFRRFKSHPNGYVGSAMFSHGLPIAPDFFFPPSKILICHKIFLFVNVNIYNAYVTIMLQII